VATVYQRCKSDKRNSNYPCTCGTGNVTRGDGSLSSNGEPTGGGYVSYETVTEERELNGNLVKTESTTAHTFAPGYHSRALTQLEVSHKRLCVDFDGRFKPCAEDWRPGVRGQGFDFIALGKALLLPDPSDWKGCFGDGDLGSCGWALTDVPFAKLGKLEKVVDLGTTCTRHSFLPGTKVLMADGSKKNIEDVKPGDRVIVTDPDTGKTTTRTVKRLITTHDDKNFVRLTLTTEDGQTGQLTTTTTHPLWVEYAGEWINAGDLLPGTTIRTTAGDTATVQAADHYTKRQTTHDLTIRDIHTYYVLAGDTPVLVHNQGGLQDDIGLGEGYTGRMDTFPMGQGADFEIHVYHRGNEVGVFGSNGWFAKHGLSADVSVPETVENRLKGKAIEFMRKTGRIGAKGTSDISGDKWKRPRLGGGC
jgi:hypothetical protein